MNWAYLKEGIVKRTNLFDVTELVMIAQISFFFSIPNGQVYNL